VNALSRRVRPGVRLTLARLRCPTSALSRLDLPTFERPAIANSKRSGGGHCSTDAALVSNAAATTRQDALGATTEGA
jgi:hypothetical protein